MTDTAKEHRPKENSRRVRGGPKFLTAEQAVSLIRPGDTLAIEGSGGGLLEPDLLLSTLGRQYAENGGPGNLTLVHTTGIGDREGGGMDLLAHPGLARRIIAGNWGMAPRMSQMVVENAFEAYNFPQGVMSQLFREIAGGRPGLVTHVGIGTFCDPRLEGGRLNSVTTEDLVEVVELAGKEWLFYPSLDIDVCFIRGTTSDVDGNISLEHEGARLETLAMAQATRNRGGLVIAQVKQVASAGSLDPRTVVVPGICVDVVVVHPNQRQLVTHDYNPAFTGEIKAALSSLDPFALDQRKVVARRALAEIRDGDVVNLGVGIADGVAAVAAEEGWSDRFTLTIEQGLVGGVPARGVIFGVATNPVAVLDQPSQFDFYDGGGLDITFLGAAQIDTLGNVNVSKFGSRVVGTGGFVNISQNASTVVFCGTFTAGGLVARPAEGRLDIERDGKHRKFVKSVDQVTFSAAEARRRGQRVLYVTERAVFELGSSGLVLVEVAPGVDVQQHILAHLDGSVEVAEELRIMDPAIFTDAPLGSQWRDKFTSPNPAPPLAVQAGPAKGPSESLLEATMTGNDTRGGMRTSLALRLPLPGGGTRYHELKPRSAVHDFAGGPPVSRRAYAAAHVVIDPLTEPADGGPGTVIDWDTTISFRRHLWSLGLGVAEAMDTAQRGGGLSWPQAKELIARSGAEARNVGGALVCGAVTDQLDPAARFTLDDLASAYVEQVGWIQQSGGTPVLMASRLLAQRARGTDDYEQVYDAVLRQADGPVMLHWLGAPFDPALRSYWGTADLDDATEVVLRIITEHAERIAGIKISLLDAQREIDLRRRLPVGVEMYTGDDFNYDVLIRGDEHGHSHALLGVFDAIAAPARAALARLDEGDVDGYSALMTPTVPLARHLFAAPTWAYKTGVVFLAWLNGHQNQFHMLGGAQSARSVPHLAELFVLADQAGALADPDLAVERIRTYLAMAGFEG
jgi:acyl CoA:acetate/3-ketoacid CoA transferase